MKKFLLVSFGLLLVALLMVVVVYLYVISQIPKAGIESTEVQNSEESTDTSASTEGIPLNTLPLGDGQKAVLDKVGVDVDTFVITPAMQTCAADKLGSERMNDIIAGEAPSVVETAKLISCADGE